MSKNEANITQIKKFFMPEATTGEFRKEWEQLTEQDKDEFRVLVFEANANDGG